MDKAMNCMEIWVKECMEKLLSQYDMCKCEKCKKDIFALALNNLKPYYVSTTKGELMAKINKLYNQFETDIVIEVSKAIETVKKNPRHSEEEL